MRSRLPAPLLTRRVAVPRYELGNERNGMFLLPVGDTKRTLKVMVSDGDGWDHVSVSVMGDSFATPTWDEMSLVKRLCFKPDEVVMQLHVADDDHLNYHPGCLHLWRPQHDAIPQPPRYMVAPEPARRKEHAR